MKNKHKYITAIVLVLLSLSLFTVCASAEVETVVESGVQGEENLFSRIYAELTRYTGEIFCALTFVGSVVLAFAYKKGLLPLIEKSLLAISTAVGRIKESTKESADKTTALASDIDERLTKTSETVERLAKRVGELDASLGDSLNDEREARLEARELRTVIDAQIDMLYAIFMSSALPQYQKDEVGERVAKMKEAIRENACEE